MAQEVVESDKETSFIYGTIPYLATKLGFLRQIDGAAPACEYSLDYKKKQGTTAKMVGLRMGWIAAHIPYNELVEFSVVDIGSGNGLFVEETKDMFKRVVPYDLAGESISDQELYSMPWDLVCLTDVLEHFDDIDTLFNINFKYALISFPETPRGYDLTKWRHMKIGEHLWLLNAESFVTWVTEHGYEVIAQGCPEDLIRARWAAGRTNITTFLIKKNVR